MFRASFKKAVLYEDGSKERLSVMELEQRIRNVISETIRPALQGHGGDIDFVSFEAASGCLKVLLKGACGTCPFAQETLRIQVEKVLMSEFPEITSVERA